MQGAFYYLDTMINTVYIRNSNILLYIKERGNSMTNERKFYRCEVCGNMVGMVENTGVPIICCGEVMQEIIPNSVEAATEKHIPVIKKDGNSITVEVGSVIHPMTAEHQINWIAVAAGSFTVRIKLNPGDEPKMQISLPYEGPITAYAYCNLHGLWKSEIA